ncbi:hypothetical protein [Desulfovibrio sp. JC010]|uniref:hypothetical protein n=1 Tax=Desulfovibrio sp. JC010 TaxID=2593641 RepID=UPI0013D8B410|nr:hypothetical protein [Desulfovibrio sp. JC010]NDV26190.1 hypothetical protein [Desulfovibrio sp. JC010]
MDTNKELELFAKRNVALIVLVSIAVFYLVLDAFLNLKLASTYLKLELILFNLAIAILSSAIFFVFIVYIPERRRQLIILNNLKNVYKDFKCECISLFLSAGKDYFDANIDCELVESLVSPENFKKYFSIKDDGLSDRWILISNNFDYDPYYRKALDEEIVIFLKEIEFLLVKFDFDADEEFRFFKNVYRLLFKYRDAQEDDFKMFFGILWQIFAAWSWIDGYSDEDYFSKRIDSC